METGQPLGLDKTSPTSDYREVKHKPGDAELVIAKCIAMSTETPLAVDLDGTLIHTDVFWESLTALVKQNIFSILLLPLWLIKGKAYLKCEIAKRVNLDVSALPYNDEFITFLREEQRDGRKLVLTTGAASVIAQQIADHLGIFSDVIATTGQKNMTGKRKAKALQHRFGNRGFEYAGNENADLSVWAESCGAIVVNAPERLLPKIQKIARVSRSFRKRTTQLAALIRVIRPKHWIKNTLIFVPLIISQELFNIPLVLKSACMFVAFSLIGSSVYILNELCNLNNDRQHQENRQRPFASGELSLPNGLVLAPLLLLMGILVTIVLPGQSLLVLAGYYTVMLAYLFCLKQFVLLDVILLAISYCLRILAGAVATNTVLSPWLLVFSMFTFLSLAFVKRVSELQFWPEK